MILIHSQLALTSSALTLEMEVELVNRAVRQNTHIEVVGPHMDLWPNHCGEVAVMGLPALFRPPVRVEKSVHEMLDELDGRIQGKRQTVKSLRKSDAPPAIVDAVEMEIDLLTRQFLTLVDHTKAIT